MNPSWLEITGRKGEIVTRIEKEEIISTLKSQFNENSSLIVCDYRGLGVKDLEVLRDSAREAGLNVQVIKNTLASLALKAAGKPSIELKDTNIFIWGNDSLSLSKVVAKFEEKNNKFFKMKAAILDNEVANIDEVVAMSKLPSRDELIAMLLQVWNAPVQNFVIGLNALKEKKEQESA